MRPSANFRNASDVDVVGITIGVGDGVAHVVRVRLFEMDCKDYSSKTYDQ